MGIVLVLVLVMYIHPILLIYQWVGFIEYVHMVLNLVNNDYMWCIITILKAAIKAYNIHR